MRKIIQISTVLGDDYIRAALCDDGTLWESVGGAEWTQVRPIPQPKQEAEKSGNDWIEWEGGECPLPPNIPVSLKFDDGSYDSTSEAGEWSWEVYQYPNRRNIIAYRIHNSQTNPKEG